MAQLTKDQVQALRDAGVSESAIIDRILQDSPQQEQAKSADPEPKQPDQTQEQKKQEQDTADKQDAILNAIEKLTGALQLQNLHNDGHGGKQESVNDILAGVLTPEKKGGK